MSIYGRGRLFPMRTRIRALESYFLACAIAGILFLMAGAIPVLAEHRSMFRLASATLILPSLIGTLLLRRLKQQFEREEGRQSS